MKINDQIDLPDDEIEFHAIRAQGSGGQNVNKVSSAVHLRFNVAGSSLPADCIERLLAMSDQRLTQDGVLVIKAQEFRSLEKNRQAALERLRELIIRALHRPRKRRPTRPTLASQQRRMDDKNRRGEKKKLRGKPDF